VNDWLRALADGHEAHLWHVDPEQVTDDLLLAAYRDLLSPAERERMARFAFERLRRDYLVTRALVRTTLSIYQPAVDPRSWQFVANPYGRPEIQAPLAAPRLRFNLSHTDRSIVCLVAVEREIGVDVEDTARAGSFGTEIAQRFFSPLEVAELQSLPPEAQPSRFFDYWTLKEAYIKARGLGLQLPLDQFSFHLGAPAPGSDRRPGGHPSRRASVPANPIRISFGPQIPDDPATWQFDLRDLAPRHRLAVAMRRAPNEPDLTLRLLPVVPLSQPPRPST
jgi:4'-phosphopantetheinyl transferase